MAIFTPAYIPKEEMEVLGVITLIKSYISISFISHQYCIIIFSIFEILLGLSGARYLKYIKDVIIVIYRLIHIRSKLSSLQALHRATGVLNPCWVRPEDRVRQHTNIHTVRHTKKTEKGRQT